MHWVAFGIPPGQNSLREGALPAGAQQGTNSFGKIGYGGPCPPPGDPPHHYVFTLYAVGSSRTAQLPSGASANQVLDAIRCCLLATASLVGLYGR